MKYVCLVYLEESKLRAVPDRECLSSGEKFRSEGLLVAAEALQPVRTAKSVRVRKGQMMITDGPFAETKEQLLGLYIVDCESQEEAVGIARSLPSLGSIFEVRPVRRYFPARDTRGR
jgi:hypothetical protein